MDHTFRRIVTGRNKDGKSFIDKDTELQIGPHSWIDFWKTNFVPASLEDEFDVVSTAPSLEPPRGGTCFRFFEIPPQDPDLTSEQAQHAAAEAFASWGASHCRVDTSRNPMMHTTSTIDYVVILRGKVTLIVDNGEVTLKPFDVVVQRGTNHYWLNYENEPALLMGVLVDAK
jgi:mannose-6-phosphate isomerase-like protein (cupin superfamily)